MTDAARPTNASLRRPVRAWIWGGGLLAGSAVVPLIASPGSVVLVLSLFSAVAQVLFAAALTILAVGLGGEGSVVARRPLGVTAMVVLAVVVPLFGILAPTVYDPAQPGVSLTFGYVQLAVQAAAALITVVMIGRARVVPDPWRWAPAWGLAVIAAMRVAGEVFLVAAGDGASQEQLGLLLAVSSAVFTLVPLALGGLALLLGARGVASAPTQVYPPV